MKALEYIKRNCHSDDELKAIQYAVKAAEIVFKKDVDIDRFKRMLACHDSRHQYNMRTLEKYHLTAKEFNILYIVYNAVEFNK